MKKIKNETKGFTLIELLVVVLIIVILAAVALPKYQIAVTKTRFATLKELTHKIVEAQEYHYLLKGSYATKFKDLDVEMPLDKLDTSNESYYKYTWGACKLFGDYNTVRCETVKMGYERRYSLSTYYQVLGRCLYYGTDMTSPQAKVCQQETKHTDPDEKPEFERRWYYYQ